MFKNGYDLLQKTIVRKGPIAASSSNSGAAVVAATPSSPNRSVNVTSDNTIIAGKLAKSESESNIWRQKCSDMEARLLAEQEALKLLRQEHGQLKAKYGELEKEQEDLLVCLAEQDLEMKKLKDRLRAHGETIEEDEDLEEEEE